MSKSYKFDCQSFWIVDFFVKVLGQIFHDSPKGVVSFMNVL